MHVKSKILAEMFQLSRNISNYYFNAIKEEDPHRIFKVNDVPLNNVYWLIGHLVNSEEALISQQIGINNFMTDWLPMFDYGTMVPKKGEGPAFEEIVALYHEVHKATLEKLPLFQDEKLGDKSPTGFKIGRLETIEHSIMHGIRHESCHSGHLGWLMKLYKNVNS